MLRYPFPRGNVKLKNMISLIVDARYPDEDRKCALKRVRQAIKDGRKAKKNPLPPGRVFYDKDFSKWALKRWPMLSERIEGIPQYVREIAYLDSSDSIQAYDIDDPADLEKLVNLYLEERLSGEERLGDYLADLKRAFVKAEHQCCDLLNQNKRILIEYTECRDKLGAYEKKDDDRRAKCSESGKRKRGCKHEKMVEK